MNQSLLKFSTGNNSVDPEYLHFRDRNSSRSEFAVPYRAQVDKVLAKYLERELSQPPPLQRLARTCIRHCLRTCIAHKAASLQLPLIIFKDLNLDGVVP